MATVFASPDGTLIGLGGENSVSFLCVESGSSSNMAILGACKVEAQFLVGFSDFGVIRLVSTLYGRWLRPDMKYSTL